MTEAQVFEQRGKLQAGEGAPGTVEVVAGFRLLTSTRMIQELIAHAQVFLAAAVTRCAFLVAVSFAIHRCRRNCDVWTRPETGSITNVTNGADMK